MMKHYESTCWTLIEAAAAGGSQEGELFAQRYGSVIRAYLRARWEKTGYFKDLEDAVQEVFLECFRRGGLLEKADRSHGGAFRAFLHGAVRNVALRIETRQGRRREKQLAEEEEAELQQQEDSLATVFHRAWARSLLREAVERQRELAQERGERAVQRVELLRLRFEEGVPIREIAQRWQADAARLHHEYARARKEFREALLEVVAFHHPGEPKDVERQAAELLAALG